MKKRRKEDLKEPKKILFIFARYIIILLLALPNLFIFYFIFTPLTVYPVNAILSLFYPSYVSGSSIFVDSVQISLVEACIAGSAFYLLVLLNLATPMKAKKRIYSLAFSLSLFLVINIVRIVIFSMLYLSEFRYFDVTHLAFWYVISGALVFLVWLSTIKLFRINQIPFYSDILSFYQKSH